MLAVGQRILPRTCTMPSTGSFTVGQKYPPVQPATLHTLWSMQQQLATLRALPLNTVTWGQQLPASGLLQFKPLYWVSMDHPIYIYRAIQIQLMTELDLLKVVSSYHVQYFWVDCPDRMVAISYWLLVTDLVTSLQWLKVDG